MESHDNRIIEDLQLKLKEQQRIISGLVSEYHALYYFNIKEKTFKVYSLDREKFPEIGQMVSHGGDPLEVFRTFGKSDFVHPEDKHLFEDITVASVCEKLAHSKKISYRFRRRFGTQYLWTQLEKAYKAAESANRSKTSFL